MLLRLWMLLVPSTESRRTMRSVTRLAGRSTPSKSRGTGGQNNHCSSPNSAMASAAFIGGMAVKVHPRWKAFSRQYFVRGLTAVVSLGVLLQLGPQVFAADSAAKIYEEARKAERAGQMVQAYV